MIKVLNLHKSFEEHKVLQGINIQVDSGKIYGLVGSNGCGKTTVFKHIIGIYKGDSGDIKYKDKSIKDQSYLTNIYYVQDDLFFPTNYSLKDLFKYESLLYPTMNEAKYNQMISFFNVDENKKLRELSKGQKKQAAFVLAIASMTETLILDEIVDGLDAVIRQKFWKVIMSEVMDRHLTVLISSHALTELDNVCDKIGILHDGAIVREDDMDKLKEETKRVQFALKEEFVVQEKETFDIVKLQQIGKVYYAVIKGDIEDFRHNLYDNNNVLLYEELSMNLEEVFITELGGLGYGGETYE